MKTKFEEPDYFVNNRDSYFLGFIYFNNKDKRIIVPRRKGTGYGGTFNFGRYQTYLIIAAFIATVSIIAHFSH